MSSRQHTALLLIAIVLAFFWIQIPWLKSLSLQASALTTIVYILIKRRKKTKIHHILPQQNSAEMALVTFILMLLVGSTGSLSSPLYPLTYVHLFFLVMSSSRLTALTIGPTTALFYFGLEPSISYSNIGHLITIPIILFIFILARDQHEELLLEKQSLQLDDDLLLKYSEETRQLQQTINKLENKEATYAAQIKDFHSILIRVQNQLFAWSQQYFACEPQPTSEADTLYQEISQALRSDETKE